MLITGQIRGEIKGDVTLAGQEDSIKVLSLDYEIKLPTDPGSGMHTGKRKHSDVILIKEIDNATVNLYNAFSLHEELEVEFRLWRSNSNTMVNLQIIKLSNCYITSMNLFSVPTVLGMVFDQFEKVSLSYKNIEIISPLENEYFKDSWQNGNSNNSLGTANQLTLIRPRNMDRIHSQMINR